MIKIKVGLGSCSISAGALEIYNEFEKELSKKPSFVLSKTGCIGSCYLEPIVALFVNDFEPILFSEVVPKDTRQILAFAQKLGKNLKPFHKKIFAKIRSGKKVLEKIPYLDETGFYLHQKKRVSRRCGLINPEDINDYISMDGFSALKKALSMKPEKVIEEIKKSGLRGRGGAGFPTGDKWELLRKAPGNEKYLVCNFDEGDPGAFMNRALVESDPFEVIEGIIISAYASGAKGAFIYTRAEYPLAVKRLKNAIEESEKHNFLGKKILGTPFSLSIEMRIGAGAFVCGEETALIRSIEGFSGRPHPKPPYPTEKGLWGFPTAINNVETICNVPEIILRGAEFFRSSGTESSPGTKMFSLSGDIKKTGYIEIPFGTTLHQISEIADFGKDDFKVVQLGGPSGGMIGKAQFEMPIDYESVKKADAIVGSGGLVVVGKGKSMIDCIKYSLRFIVSESCGKCTPCREGTMRMLEIIERISEGKGTPEDMLNLHVLSNTIRSTAICGLGQTAPNLIFSSIRNFFSEYEENIPEWKGRKPNIVRYEITAGECRGCHLCATICPKSAISGKSGEIHEINDAMCVRCGMCFAECPFKAISEHLADRKNSTGK
ncbi:MAG: 4Fe-4S binding protein [Candidatus Woesearchaeota archaeon]|nr:4Fe-4S binding protein [Candidatus Woesearchaeota archaeon]